jgi:hypothetical protein
MSASSSKVARYLRLRTLIACFPCVNFAQRCCFTARMTSRKGCGTRDQHRTWLNTDVCGLVCGTMVWVIAIACWYGLLVRTGVHCSSEHPVEAQHPATLPA